ncbi:hypothetical protein HanXRQr2_Chr11g0518351 [Helianthus annuus]|uniref:Uncharacterized protein n=1 Tax=Helianthus annuus TaxID=4232 RepID=A0A9K3HU99_HELAN|nr:hypothetical protein HanXRQr2_Chr11g0518351 [Helianthus annuus]KAJ0877389.1 hypothetical protein HanPSC8_Chr11g0499571 [Helianthus annuus]
MNGSIIFSGVRSGFCLKKILNLFQGCARPPCSSPGSAPASDHKFYLRIHGLATT